MLLVTKPVSSLNVTFSDENKSSLKGKRWLLVLLFAMNPTSLLKGIQQWRNQIVTKDEVYISHFSSIFFSHQTFIPSQLILKLSFTAQPIDTNVDWARQRQPRLPPVMPTQTLAIDATHHIKPTQSHLSLTTIKPPNHLGAPIAHDSTFELEESDIYSLVCSNSPEFANKPIRVCKAVLQALAGEACCRPQSHAVLAAGEHSVLPHEFLAKQTARMRITSASNLRR